MNRLLSIITPLLLSVTVLAQNKADVIVKNNEEGPGEKSDTRLPAPAAAGSQRKVAILPFTVTQNGHLLPEETGMQVQNECYAILREHAGKYTIMEPRQTIVLLNKAGITQADMMKYGMDEICRILGVAYVIDGMVSIHQTTETISRSSSPGTGVNTGTSTSSVMYSQDYQTSLDLKIYNDQGVAVYSKNRESLGDTVDSHKPTLAYVLKRSPLYSR
ncbi:hypothetical protein [Chitinophaga flava]|nr:hypothetical protein [Chitinophaga flava]